MNKDYKMYHIILAFGFIILLAPMIYIVIVLLDLLMDVIIAKIDEDNLINQ